LKVGKVNGKGAIVDTKGDAVTLRGMSMFWANSVEGKPYYCDDVVGWLAYDFKASVIRAVIGVDKDGGGGLNGYADGDSAGLMSSAVAVIEACIRRGTYVIVDWHTHKTDFQSKAVSFFGIIASKYGKYPNVLYEPFNEPVQGVDFGTVKSFVTPIITEIRKTSSNLVLVGSKDWSQNPNDASSSPINDNNTAYTFHFYTNTHTYGGYGSKVSSAINNGLAVLVTEFGSVNADGDGNHNASGTDDWLTALEGWKVGWVNWSVTHKNEGASILSQNGVAGGPGGAWSNLKVNGTYIRGKIVAGNSDYYKTTTFTIGTSTTGEGSVQKKVGGAVSNGPFAYGAKVTLTAVPDDGWEWDHWEGDVGSSATSATLNEFTIKGVNVADVKAVFLPSCGVIKNGYFTHGLQSGGSNVWLQTGVTLAYEAAALKATVTAANAHVRQGNLSLQKGRKYRLTFKAKASQGSGSVTPRVTDRTRGTNYLPNPTAVPLTPQFQEVTREFDMCAATDNTATLVLECTNGMTWNLDDVRLIDVGVAGVCAVEPPDTTKPPEPPDTTKPPAAVLTPGVKSHKASWSVSRSGGALQLRGPVEAGARVSLYDVRGKVVKSMAARDGLTLGAGIPAGSYVLVVRNGAGGEVFKARVVMAR
jgi:hypothetical protein